MKWQLIDHDNDIINDQIVVGYDHEMANESN